jgi:hypothetical protein
MRCGPARFFISQPAHPAHSDLPVGLHSETPSIHINLPDAVSFLFCFPFGIFPSAAFSVFFGIFPPPPVFCERLEL